MTPEQIAVGQVLAGKGADSDKQRQVTAIDTKRRDATTDVYRNGQLIGTGCVISLHTLARWADRIITTAEETSPCPDANQKTPSPSQTLLPIWGDSATR
jgi:hypothetical protein